MQENETTDAAPLRPIDHFAQHRGSWATACLAATLRGWDPSQDDDAATVTDADYASALHEAESLLQATKTTFSQIGKLPDGAARRIFVLAHPSCMHAVICYRPGPTETNAHIVSMSEGDGLMMRLQALQDLVWTHCLWPAQGTAEMMRLMDEWPIMWAREYPNAFSDAMSPSAVRVKKK